MEHLPLWLRNLPLPARPASSADSSAGSEMPDWLRELQSEVDASSELPFDTGAAAGAPNWLADLEGDASTANQAAPPASSEPPARPQPFGATSWLASLGASDVAPADRAAPEPPKAQDADQQTSTTSRVRMPVGATDWLRSIGQDPDRKSEPISEPLSASDESGVPEWLRDLSADEVARAVEAELPDSQPRFDPQAPGWLADDGRMPDASTVSANWARREPQADTASDDVPEWLRDVAEREGSEPPQLEQPDARQPEHEALTNLAGGAEVPAWLRDLGEPPEAEPPAPAHDASSDWLSAADEQPASPWDAPAIQDEDVPAWLRESEQSPPPQAPAPRAARENDEVPAWLRESEQSPPPQAPAPRAAREKDEVPAWLRESEQSPPAPTAGEPDAPTWLRDAIAERQGAASLSTPPDSDVPAWLMEEAAPPPAALPLAPPPKPRPASDLPAWLAAEAPAEELRQPSAPTSGDAGLPSWLRGVADEPPVAPPTARAEPPWRPSPVAEEGESNSFLKGAELPSWLRVPAPELPTESPEGQQLDWLRRLGSAEQEEEAEPGASVAAIVRPQRLEYQRSPNQLEAIALLRSLTRSPYPAPVAAPALVPKTWLERIGLDRVLYALFALALVLGLLFPQLTAPFQTVAPTAPGAAELGALLDGLGSEDVVLVAYEWAAQRSGELRPLEDAALRRLIANKTKLILVSTDMQGTLLAFDLREPLRAAGYNLDPNGQVFGGRDYVLLGYRPGGELALRSLAQDLRGELASDFEGRDATKGLLATNLDGTPRISGLQDLSLILVLADQPQDVQAWMEQIRSAARDVPIAFVLPEETQPVAQPYLRLPGVYHVSGQQGALALLAAQGLAEPGVIARASGALWYAVLIFLVLLLLGALVATATRSRSRGGSA